MENLNTFDALLALQDLDQDLLRQRRTYSQITQDLQDRANRLKSLRDERDRAKRTQLQAEVAMKRLELERASENQRRLEMEDRLYGDYGTNNPRDLIKMELRVQEHSNRIETIEKEIEPIRVAAREAGQVLTDLEERVATMEIEWEEQKKIGTDEQARIAEEYNEALKYRNETANEVPKRHLGEYTRLFKNNGGTAVTVVERDICAGCSERVSMGELNTLKNSTEPILCHCGKYLITLSVG